MRYEIIEVGQECGEVEYQVSDVHPNGERTHSYDFMTLAEAEECLDELNTINNNGETKMNTFTKISLIIAILIGSMFITTTAEARGWGSACDAACSAAADQKIKDSWKDQGLDENGQPIEGGKASGSSAKEKARVAAQIERLHREFRESGAKDLDELYPEFFNGRDSDGKTYAEREAEKCWEDTWYGKKEITCEDK